MEGECLDGQWQVVYGLVEACVEGNTSRGRKSTVGKQTLRSRAGYESRYMSTVNRAQQGTRGHVQWALNAMSRSDLVEVKIVVGGDGSKCNTSQRHGGVWRTLRCCGEG